MIKHIDIARDFSPDLGPRWRRLGKFSGEEFYEDLLRPAFVEAEMVVVDLSGIEGPSPSFFEEAFGGLVREFGKSNVDQKLRFRAGPNSHLKSQIERYMADAKTSR